MSKKTRTDKPFLVWLALVDEQIRENETAARILSKQVKLHRALAKTNRELRRSALNQRPINPT